MSSRFDLALSYGWLICWKRTTPFSVFPSLSFVLNAVPVMIPVICSSVLHFSILGVAVALPDTAVRGLPFRAASSLTHSRTRNLPSFSVLICRRSLEPDPSVDSIPFPPPTHRFFPSLSAPKRLLIFFIFQYPLPRYHFSTFHLHVPILTLLACRPDPEYIVTPDQDLAQRAREVVFYVFFGVGELDVHVAVDRDPICPKFSILLGEGIPLLVEGERKGGGEVLLTVCPCTQSHST